MEGLNAEIRDLEELIPNLPDGEENSPAGNRRTAAVTGNNPILSSNAAAQSSRNADGEDKEYRSAFMDFVMRKTPIPKDVAESRADAVTMTTDVGTVIPTVVLNKIIEKIEAVGMIISRVTRTAFPAGMTIPTSAVKPVAVWVNEGQGSDKQKKTTGSIVFTHFKLRCEIAITLETSVMTLSAFESSFVRQVSEAMVRALETAVLNGDGTTQPKGILTETPSSDKSLEVTGLSYGTVIAAEAALPQEYEAGAVWLMSRSTFLQFMGITDDNNRPIANVYIGDKGKPQKYLFGREVVETADYLPSFSVSLDDDTVFAALFNLKDYTLNTNYTMGIKFKEDWDTENQLAKSVMLADGKVTDKNSLVILKKATEEDVET
jgi:HK97 family phage major capsid protein